jgi:two-component system response regulator HydG
LENIIERMVLLSEGNILTRDNLPDELTGVELSENNGTLKKGRDVIIKATERKMIVDALDSTGGNRTRAAKILGVSRRTLQNKIKDYDL